nr:bifunctional proline dehydrogenase/L-glutamate gamma-semialdehyde dehydrogenase [Actinomycetota bacterium]
QLFRFVDVFPALRGDADVLRHVQEYFEGTEVPKLLEHGVHMAGTVPFGGKMSAAVARRNIERMGQQFIVGQSPAEAIEGLHRLWQEGSAFTVDLLGEKTVTEAEADHYAARLGDLLTALVGSTAGWAHRHQLESDDIGPLPRANVSIKPTALASLYAPLTADEGLAQARARLQPILRMAAEQGAFVWFDMEHYETKELTLTLFRDVATDPGLAGLQTGVVIQAYLEDAHADLSDLIAWAAAAGRETPVGIRLVKGAYWDSETITSRAEGWPVPVFAEKAQTDANFERCTRLLHDHHGTVRAAFGSHNLRSLAYAVAYAQNLGVPDNGYELQMLYGMAEPVQAAIRRLGLRLRVYAPVGELVPGMAYLVRRLLENTSNESFVRHRFAEERPVEELVAVPDVDDLPDRAPPARRPPTDPSWPGTYAHEPVFEWRRPVVRSDFNRSVASVSVGFPVEIPAVIGGERVLTGRSIDSVDPGDPDTVVATSASCGAKEAGDAIQAAGAALESWRRTPVVERAAVLFRAAEWMRARRQDLAALQVYEAGKPGPEADADVCEAIDFCEYYGREMLRLDQGGVVQSPPGEANSLRYQGKGIGVVISPWNFPLAIPTGMVAASLVAGNAVLLKPAEQTPAVAYRLVEALEAGGLPPGVLAFLPGIGEELGAHLVAQPEVAFVVFTGSKAVGLRINEVAAAPRPGQRHVKRVVAEMGGKNAVVVDADADLDHAVPAIAGSAFGYAGQKCSAASRVIVVGAVHDELVERLVGHTRELRVGHPKDLSVKVGPLIDLDAWKRVTSYVERAETEGTVLLARTDVPDTGYFVGPTIVGDVSFASPLARDEIFGPVLTVSRAADLDDAMAMANDTDYALTASLFSRSPASIAKASVELRAGNVYVNRGTTGAVVGRQPFGGYGLSGVGSKAGGPDYLLQFLDPRVVTENTVRQGFAPD